LLRRSNYVADVVERFIQRPGERSGFRKDFLGFADIVAARKGEGVLAVQCTSLSNLSSRLAKARSKAELSTWLSSGAKFECHGWYQSGDGRWRVRRVEVKPGDVLALIGIPRRTRKPTQKGLFDEFGKFAG
jgi:hypothetical protein